ncbi:MAG: fructosamine kinase family protein [Gammaproteobacteria bacterium]|nr:fructosamine kinase family protein [Gammaproteobacteria bacterium]
MLAAVAAATGHHELRAVTSISGGSISAAWRLASPTGALLLKFADAAAADMFAAEAEGLAAIAATETLRVPAVLGTGVTGAHAWLALEWLDLTAPDEACQRRLGAGLAAMHAHSAARHGWHRDNTIGATPQSNDWCEDWCEFWTRRRLVPQLELAADNGAPARLCSLGDRLLGATASLLGGHEPAASLLHGDLWSGNQAADSAGHPVIFDPAVHYGDRETDLAMTRLFGGFAPAFYDAYEQTWPLPDGWQARVALYQLYHVLNHFNLFGGGYGAQAEQMMAGLLEA